MLDTVTVDTFQPYVGELFQITIGEEELVDMYLVEVAPLPEQKRPIFGQQATEPSPRQPFALVFRAPLESPLPQRMYLLTHPQLGRFEHIFLVPIAEDREGFYYEAVFN